MSQDNLNIENFCIRAQFTESEHRTDHIIPTPSLISPRDGFTFCEDLADGNICLEWANNANINEPDCFPSEYLIQFSLNAEFNGPSVSEELTTNTKYILKPGDIPYGIQIYWRVIALNEATNAVSWKTETRTIQWNCGEGNQSDSNLCGKYDVNLELSLIHI